MRQTRKQAATRQKRQGVSGRRHRPAKPELQPAGVATATEMDAAERAAEASRRPGGGGVRVCEPLPILAARLVEVLRERKAFDISSAVPLGELAAVMGIPGPSLVYLSNDLRGPLFAVLPVRTRFNPNAHALYLALSSRVVADAAAHVEEIIQDFTDDAREYQALAATMDRACTVAERQIADDRECEVEDAVA